MPATSFQVLSAQVQFLQFLQVGGTQPRKFVEQLPQRLALNRLLVSRTIERFKRLSFAELQDHFDSRHPVRQFAMIQVADNVESAPRFLSFIPERPQFRKIPQKRAKRGGSA